MVNDNQLVFAKTSLNRNWVSFFLIRFLFIISFLTSAELNLKNNRFVIITAIVSNFAHQFAELLAVWMNASALLVCFLGAYFRSEFDQSEFSQQHDKKSIKWRLSDISITYNNNGDKFVLRNASYSFQFFLMWTGKKSDIWFTFFLFLN